MRNVSLTLTVLLVLTIGLTLGACRNQQQPTPTPPPTATAADEAAADGTPVARDPVLPTAAPTPTADATSGELVLWHAWAQTDGDALAAILDAAQRAYPDLTVETLFVANDDLPQAYADAVAADGGPDLLLAPNWWLDDLAARDALLPIGDLVAAETLADYAPAALDNLSAGGTLYGLPLSVETVALFYNQSLLGDVEPPLTMDEWLVQARTAAKQGTGLYASLYHVYWGIPAYGGTLVDNDGAVVMTENEGTAEFLAWLAALDETEGSYVDIDYGMLKDRFKKSEFAFFVDGPWATAELRDALGDDLAVAPLPAGPAAPAQPWLSADGLFVNAAASPEQQARALRFAEFATGAEAGALLAEVANRLPAHQQAEIEGNPILSGFLQQSANAQAMPPALESDADFWAYAGDMLLRVLNDDATAEVAVREAEALINEAGGR